MFPESMTSVRFQATVFVGLFLFAAFHGSVLKSRCPVIDHNGPCKCLDLHGELHAICDKVSSHEQLTAFMMNMAGYSITTFDLLNSKLRFLPPTLFVNSSVERLKILHTELYYLSSDSFESDVLTSIHMEYVRFDGGFDWTVLENLSNLTMLRIEKTSLDKIPPDVGDLRLSIETIVISEGELEYIYRTAFQNFKDLKLLKLNGNLIQRFSRPMLPLPVAKLQLLDLSDNQLTNLPTKMFDGTPDLHSLLLGGNFLTTMNENPFAKLWPQLVFFDITDNRLNCNCSLAWIARKKQIPFHFYGHCSMIDGTQKVSLSKLYEKDFQHCKS